MSINSNKVEMDATASAGAPARTAGLRILIVEDNKANELLVNTWLEKAGHDTVLAGNGLEAIEAVKRERYDVVLMDIQMPQMDGIEATKCIRALPDPAARIPIIAMTANAITGDRESCLEAGMDDYISKPFNAAKLLDTIDHWATIAAERRAASDDPNTGPSGSATGGGYDNLTAEAQGALEGLLAELRALDSSAEGA